MLSRWQSKVFTLFCVLGKINYATSFLCSKGCPNPLDSKDISLFERKSNNDLSRRTFWAQSILTTITISASSAQSSYANTLPKAPIETLIPATRVKLNLDRLNEIANKIKMGLVDANYVDTIEYKSLIEQLKALCLLRQNYTGDLKLQGVPEKPADLYLDAYKPMKGDLPFQRFLIVNGDVGTWKDLKKKEKDQERGNEVRAAFNAYTDALSFSGDSYILNVDKATRSTMVREDLLPDVKQVITSDMGMRYLFRNQVLTAMDDLRAEMEYVNTHPAETIDIDEIIKQINLAQTACNKWFSLIDSQDVNEAIQYVLDNH